MSTSATSVPFDDIPFDLIGALAESNDARIRGNAVQALAILASDKNSGLAGRAQELLIRALAAGPASLEPEWYRRFRTRALDALRELGPEQREDVLKKVMIANMRSTDKNQRAAVSTLLWEASSADLFRSVNWLQLRRLAGRVGKTRFWTVLWAATWRYVLLFFALWSLLTLVTYAIPEFAPDQMDTIFNLIVLYVFILLLPTFVLTHVAFVGRPKLPLVYRAADILVSGLVFGTVCIVGTFALIDNSDSVKDFFRGLLEFSTESLLSLGVLGFIIGAAIRSIKWFPEAKVIAAYRLRPVWAFLIASVACMVAAKLGVDTRVSGAAWLTTASAAVVIAALDDWLEKRGPDLDTTSKAPSWQLTALLAATVSLFVLGTGWNIWQAWPKRTVVARKITLPDDLEKDFPEKLPKLPILDLTVNQEGRYTIQASVSPWTAIALIVQSDDEISRPREARLKDRRIDNRESRQEKLSFSYSFTQGTYKGCVNLWHMRDEDCKSRKYIVTRPEFLDLAGLFIAGTPISESENEFRVRISRADNETKDTVPKEESPASNEPR
jgi:hypothetical protein